MSIRKNAGLVFLVTAFFFQVAFPHSSFAQSSSTPAVTSNSASSGSDRTSTQEAKPGAPGATNTANGTPDTAKGYSQPGEEAGAGSIRPLEDFSSLKVPSTLELEVFPVQGADFPEYSKELIRAEWRPWDKFDFYVLKPAGVKKPPVILYLYSYPSTLSRYTFPEVCKFLTKNGFAAVGFLPALTGDRFVGRPTREWFVSDLQEALSTTVHDVQIILNYLEKRGDLDMTRVGMFGDGAGASIAILAASVDPRIKALDLLDPWGDWPDWMAKSSLIPNSERPDYLKPEFLKTLGNMDPVKVLPELKTQHVRLQQIKDLTVTPAAVRERFQAVVQPDVKVVQYDTTKAFLTNVAPGKALNWLEDQLGSVSASSDAKEKFSAATASSK